MNIFEKCLLITMPVLLITQNAYISRAATVKKAPVQKAPIVCTFQGFHKDDVVTLFVKNSGQIMPTPALVTKVVGCNVTVNYQGRIYLVNNQSPDGIWLGQPSNYFPKSW
jgi:hypothetical protein